MSKQSKSLFDPPFSPASDYEDVPSAPKLEPDSASLPNLASNSNSRSLAPPAPSALKWTGTGACAAYIEELKQEFDLGIGGTCPLCEHAVVNHRRIAGSASTADSALPSIPESSSSKGESRFLQTFSKIEKSLPKWKKETTICRVFLQEIGLLLAETDLPRRKWCKVLTYVMHDAGVTARQWIKDNIINKKLDWDDTCKAFTAHFENSDYTEALKKEYRSCKQNKSESVQSYIFGSV